MSAACDHASCLKSPVLDIHPAGASVLKVPWLSHAKLQSVSKQQCMTACNVCQVLKALMICSQVDLQSARSIGVVDAPSFCMVTCGLQVL